MATRRSPGDPPDRKAACERKTPYKTRKRALESMNIRRADGAPPLEVYKCSQGRHWHLAKERPKSEEGGT